MGKRLSITQTVAPEDLQRGDYITVSHETLELFPCDESSWRTEVEPLTCRIRPSFAGHPLQVVSACLPFVLTEMPDGRHVTIDLRRFSVVRLEAGYGRKAFKCLRPKEGA